MSYSTAMQLPKTRRTRGPVDLESQGEGISSEHGCDALSASSLPSIALRARLVDQPRPRQRRSGY